MRNLLRRSLSGLIFVFLFVSAILYSKESFVILTTIFAGISIWEFHKIIHFKSLASYLFFAAAVFLLLKNSDNYAVVGILGINIGPNKSTKDQKNNNKFKYLLRHRRS